MTRAPAARTPAGPPRTPHPPYVGAQTFALALEVLETMLRFDGPADGTLSTFFRAHRALGTTARGLVAESAYAVLRHRSVYQQLAQSGRGPLARRLLLLAFDDAAVDVQAVLDTDERAWLDHVRRIDRTSLPIDVRSNLPAWLWDALRARFGEPDAFALAQSLNTPAPLDARVNRLKATRDEALAALQASGPGYDARAMDYAPDGVRFAHKPALQTHPWFERGAIEVQDEGSQLLVHVLAPKRGEMIADLCAGAGGKTLAIGSLMRGTGRIYAFDVSARRLERLKPRLVRSGLSNVVVAAIAHEHDVRIKRLAGKLDRVLVDAPCSGLGTLRRNPDLKWRQTPQSVREMAVKQASILASAARLVKRGGRLVYATCSLLDEENDAIADAFLAAHPTFAPVHVGRELERQHIALPMEERLRLLPHLHATDGFFAAAFERVA